VNHINEAQPFYPVHRPEMNYPAASGRGIGPLIQLETLNIWLFSFLFLALILKNAAERRGMCPKIESNGGIHVEHAMEETRD